MHYFLVNPEFFFFVIFINYVNPESPHTFSYACIVYFCVNASGKHPEKPIIIGHNKKPHDFPNNWWWKKYCHYAYNKNAWMTMEMWEKNLKS